MIHRHGLAVSLAAALALAALCSGARADSPYTRTITTSFKVFVDVRDMPSPGTIDRLQTVRLGAAVRQASYDWSWLALLDPAGVPSDTTTAPVDPPAAASFIAARMPGATIAPYTPGVVARYTLHNPDPDHVKYFYLPDSGAAWTRYEVSQVVIGVSGRVVLLVPRGIHFESPMTVQSEGDPSTDGIAIVAGGSTSIEPNLGPMPIGIEFSGGLVSSQVPVVLVSDGSIVLDQFNGDLAGLNHYARYVSIYAGGVYLRGPLNSHNSTTTFDHPADAPEDAPGGFIDWMSQQGALPNTGSGTPVKTTTWGGLKARYH